MSRTLAYFAFVYLVSFSACARHKSSAPERLAITPFENLSASTEFDWLGRALSAAVAYDLTGLANIYAQPVDSLDSAYGMQASRALQGYFIQTNGRLQLHASVLDLASRKTVATFELDGPVTQGAVALADELSKKLSTGARAFPTTNANAFRAYGDALKGGDRAAILQLLEKATQADPQFSLAYLERAQILAGGGDRAGALPVIEEAKRGRTDPVTGARLDLLAASIQANQNGRMRDLETLSRLTPADATVFEELGQVELSERRISDAVRSYEADARINPENATTWNEVGYARSYAGDLNGARSALEEYQRLEPPENVNPLDSLGEVSFYLGDFHSAEKYFLDADHKNASEFGGADLLKAAQARLMTGDVAGADALFKRYIGRENGRGQAAHQTAQWEFLTGRRQAAMTGLERMIPSLEGDGRSVLLSQLSVWKLQTGDQKAAAQLAAEAAESAVGPTARNLSALCRVISNPEAGPSGSRFADAYSRLAAGKFDEAAPLLEMLYRETDPHTDGQVRTLLAWIHVKMGRTSEARSMIAVYPIPFTSGETLFATWIFPRYLFVRGAVLQQEGKRAEAKAAYELYLKLAGDVPDAFGDQAAARKNLSGL